MLLLVSLADNPGETALCSIILSVSRSISCCVLLEGRRPREGW